MGDTEMPNTDDIDIKMCTEENPNINITTLEECFKNIVDGISIEFELENLNNILKKDLQVNFYYLKPKLKNVIPYMLVHYIKNWPGWQKNSSYVNKQITFNSWFKKFKEYLVFKINYLIKNDFDKVQAMIKSNTPIDDKVLFKIDNSTQTKLQAEKQVAPFSIQMQGLPKMLNSLIFCEGSGGTILVKEYKANPFAANLTTKQLINWPHVEVEFLAEELHFKRKNMHEFKRYLMLSNEKITFKKVDGIIEAVEIVNEGVDRQVYTLNVLREYCDTYVEIMRKHRQTVGISVEYINDIKTVFEEFLADIKELDMNSMATNTSVLFNIGKYIYARNKSIRTRGQMVSFAESISPKVDISLLNFSGVKDENSDTPFQGLQDILDSTDTRVIKKLLPSIRYGCTYCDKRFSIKSGLLDHFVAEHYMESPILCFKCKLQLDVATVCENRWNHRCKQNTDQNVIT